MIAVLHLSTGATLPPAYSQIQYLFRVSQGANSQYPPGLWGGEMDHSGNGVGEDLFKYGYSTSVSQSVNPESVSQSLSLHSVSYDEASQEAMLVLEDGVKSGASTSSYTAVAGALCEADDGKMRLLFTRPLLQHPEHPYLFDADCGFKCGWGPFAFHNGKVYFILSAVFGKIPSLLTRRIELRQLVPCADEDEELTEPLEDFNLLECSKPLALLHSEAYRKPSPQVKVWPAHSMKAATVGGEDVFFLQLFDRSTGETMLHLVIAKPDTNTTQTLYTRGDVADRYASSGHIQGFAAIDYRDGFLCWTVADALLCVYYSGQDEATAFDYITLLQPWDANNHSVCTGTCIS
jgi:hypothetical protein